MQGRENQQIEREVERPTVDDSWDRLTKEVSKYDDVAVKLWKEDIDTLLVFVRAQFQV
jgi:hypothetical protein